MAQSGQRRDLRYLVKKYSQRCDHVGLMCAVLLVTFVGICGHYQMFHTDEISGYAGVIGCLAALTLSSMTADILYRFIFTISEIASLKDKYNGNIRNFLKESFGHNVKQSEMIFILGLIIFCIINSVHDSIFIVVIMNNVWYLWTNHWEIFITLIIVESCVKYLLGLRKPTFMEMDKMMEEASLNVGHGMAWVYHVGYLKLILPGMGERISESQFWEEKIKGQAIMAPKFFVLLPESCFAFPTLADADPRISHAGPLKEFSVNRAGNVKRTYRNNVYTMSRGDGMKYYFTVEYATPLLSLYEMSEAPEAGLSAEQRCRQMKLFHTSLNNIFENTPECKQNVVLIPYKDKRDDGSFVPIGDVIMEAIHETLDSEAVG